MGKTSNWAQVAVIAVVAGVLFLPALALADTNVATPTLSQTQIVQLILDLQRQVRILEQQIQAIQAKQTKTTPKTATPNLQNASTTLKAPQKKQPVCHPTPGMFGACPTSA